MASCMQHSLKMKDWTLYLLLLATLTRHLVSSAPLTTETSPTPSLDHNVTTSGNYSAGHLEDGQSLTTASVGDLASGETDAATEHVTLPETEEMEVSGEVHLPTATMSALPSGDDALQTSQLPEVDSAEEPEVSYDSPVDDRCISARLVEAIKEDTQLQDLATKNAVCKWNYVYDVNTRRIPELLMKAECQKNNLSPNDTETSRCEPVYFYIAVKKMDSKGSWVDCQESLPVACVLVNNPITETHQAEDPQANDEDYNLFGEATTAGHLGSNQAEDPTNNENEYEWSA